MFDQLLIKTTSNNLKKEWQITTRMVHSKLTPGRKDSCSVVEIFDDKVLDVIAEHLAVLAHY